MKRTKKILSVLLALFVIVGAVRLPITADAATEGGMTFEDPTRMYYTDKVMTTAPKTLEAVIKNPASYDAGASSCGVIIGNYDGGKNSMNLEIFTWGAPRIVGYNNGVYYNAVFYNARAEIWAGQETHVAIVFETANTVSCYINGALKETKTLEGITNYIEETQSTWVLGNDHRYDKDAANYNGVIKSVALYSDVRSAEEIATDANSYGNDSLLLRYDMTGYTTNPVVVPDLSGNGMNASFERWVAPQDQPSVGEYDYAFAVVGDTQTINNYKTDTFQLAPLYNWIKDNAANKKIKHVFGLGDITENQTDEEYAHAVENIKKLDGIVPYSLVRGNHDNGDEKFTNNFNYEGYTSQISGRFSESSLNNTWKEFTVGSLKYLVLCLDYGAQDDVLAWAGDVIEAHPNHNVIITTHAYLYRDGTTIDDENPKDQACPTNADPENNNGDDIWNELGKKYANVTLILSGHDPNNDIVVTQATGDNGNAVTQMLIDPQGMDANMGPTGMVAIFYVSNGGSTIQIQYYSTIRDAYWGETKTITVDVVGCEHENTTAHERIEATCTTLGHEAYTICDDCGAVVSGANATIQTKPHSMTHYDKIPASPTQEGRIEYWECSLCNKKYSDADGTQVTNDLIIPAFGSELELTGASLELGESIALKFKANKNGMDNSDYKNPYIRVIVEGRETRINGVVSEGEYVFTLDKVAAHQMDDTMYVVLCAEARGVTYSSIMYDYSVREYCYNMLDEYAEDEELRTLLVDLLNYGAAAQSYMQETGTLVNANLTDAQKAWASSDVVLKNELNKTYATVESPSVTWKSAGLNLSGTITLRLKVQTSDITGLSVVVAGIDNFTATFEKIGGETYYIYIQGIALTQMDKILDITVYNGDIAVSNTLRYSIGSYAYANQSGNLGALMKAMMKVGASANAYLQ